MINLLKLAFSVILKLILLPLRIFPIRNDRIVFSGLTGGSGYEYSCNPKYLCEYIKSHVPGRFRIIWLASNPLSYKERSNDVLFLGHYNLRAFYYLMTTKIVVTNGSYAPWFPFRGKQRVINTWHGGGAYKRVENDKPDANWLTKKRAEFAAKNISLFVSSCKKASELIFRRTFLYQGEILEVGTPRNDLIVKGDVAKSAAKVRARYQIMPDERIVLYAPTYRKSAGHIILNERHLLETLSRDGTSWRLLFRAHRYQDAEMRIGIVGKEFIDVADYSDMQELLAAADMVITDYSSLIWDYSFLKRPCFLYVPDIAEYVSKTGFYVDIERWPFAQAKSNEELMKRISEYDAKEGQRRIKEHHQFMGNYETGEACKVVTDWILRECEK